MKTKACTSVIAIPGSRNTIDLIRLKQKYFRDSNAARESGAVAENDADNEEETEG